MIHIDASSIGIKSPVRVKETVKNVKNTFKFQKNVFQVGTPQGKSQSERVISYCDGQIKAIDHIIDFISDILSLTNKQIDKLNNTAFPKIEALSSQIVTKMLHYDAKEQTSGKK